MGDYPGHSPTAQNLLLIGDPLPSGGLLTLSEVALDTLVNEAIARWIAAYPEIDLAWLCDLTFQIADLPGVGMGGFVRAQQPCIGCCGARRSAETRRKEERDGRQGANGEYAMGNTE